MVLRGVRGGDVHRHLPDRRSLEPGGSLYLKMTSVPFVTDNAIKISLRHQNAGDQ